MQNFTSSQLIRSKFELGCNIFSQQGIWALLKHAKLVLLRRVHHWLWDHSFEKFETVPTGGFMLTKDLQPIDRTNLADSFGYLPSPRLVVNSILIGLQENLSTFSFVDFGSGRGRVLLMASEKPFRSVTGVEFSMDLHRDALANIANYPDERMNCNEVNSVCVDASKFILPEDDCILYFFNPFNDRLLREVVSKSVQCARTRGTRLVLVYYNPVHSEVMDGQTELKQKQLSLISRLKLKLISPYPVLVYELDRN